MLSLIHISGYGYVGDFAAFQALGPNIHAFSGLSAATGYRDGPLEQLFGTYADVIGAFRNVDAYSNAFGVSLDPSAFGPDAHRTM